MSAMLLTLVEAGKLWNGKTWVQQPLPCGTRRQGERPPKLTIEQRSAIGDDIAAGRRTAAEATRLFRVSKPTTSIAFPWIDSYHAASLIL
jgi:hypothetical protein